MGSRMNESLTLLFSRSRPASKCRSFPDRSAKSFSSTISTSLPTSHNEAGLNLTPQPSHHTASIPATPSLNNRITRHNRHSLNKYLIALILITSSCCSIVATAQPVTASSPSSLPLSVSDPFLDDEISEVQSLELQLAELASSGTILVDHRPQSVKGSAWELEEDPTKGPELRRRQNGDPFSSGSSSGSSSVPSSSDESSSSSSAKATSTPAASKTTASTKVAPAASSAVSSSIAVASPTADPGPLPSPLDTLSSAIFSSTSCPNFINSFLNNPTFKSCLPLSLLLASSNSFFQAEKSVTRITQTLDATCSASVDTCNSFLGVIANNLTSNNNCGSDYKNGNQFVVQILTSLVAYKPLYQASCLKNPSSGAYCFADAVTNASSPTDSFVYYLALNNSLPGGAQPTCSTCLQNTMAVFDSAAANRSQPVVGTYVTAATQINVLCGPGFVNATIPAPVASGAGSVRVGSTSFLILAVLAAAWLF